MMELFPSETYIYSNIESITYERQTDEQSSKGFKKVIKRKRIG